MKNVISISIFISIFCIAGDQKNKKSDESNRRVRELKVDEKKKLNKKDIDKDVLSNSKKVLVPSTASSTTTSSTTTWNNLSNSSRNKGNKVLIKGNADD